jgi:NAD(P)-dependent dehydrogenase (short-subunit alcohol dehydrogenase family)
MIVWITGASSGLGREVARQYARAGHTVCASARNVDALSSLVEGCRELDGCVRAFGLDVTDSDQVKAVLRDIQATVGLPDLTILNAGTHINNSAHDFDRQVFRKLMDINYMGTINCLQEILPAYLARRCGHIAVVSSVAGYRGLPNASAYGASKAALINMCEALQPELEAHGVRLSLINPGFVRTPLTDKNEFPMPFLMEVDAAAESLIRGLESGRFEITFPRRFTWLLKGLRILPVGIYLRLTRRLLKNG